MLREIVMTVLHNATMGEIPCHLPYILMFKSLGLIALPWRFYTRYEYLESRAIRTTLKSAHYQRKTHWFVMLCCFVLAKTSASHQLQGTSSLNS